jgi:exopolyphosphatase/pppGpp-phosphohydrolase
VSAPEPRAQAAESGAGPHVGAAVDLGSNSVHVLVATIAGHRLEPLLDTSAFLGLGAAVDTRAHLGAPARTTLIDTLAGYVDLARWHGASNITLLGTEPLRRAADAHRIVADVGAATGVPLHVLSHEEEALLTLIGVTKGRSVTHETLVADIGGGSSEFCAVGPTGPPRAVGLRIGSDRLTTRHARHDPPARGEVEAMTVAAEAALSDALDGHPDELVIVGGTAWNLLKVAPGGIADTRLTPGRLSSALATLLERPAAETAERYGLNPKRAQLLPAGAAIVEALMRRYGMTSLRVSDAGIREGAVLIADHAGRAWRDRLPGLAHGWRSD